MVGGPSDDEDDELRLELLGLLLDEDEGILLLDDDILLELLGLLLELLGLLLDEDEDILLLDDELLGLLLDDDDDEVLLLLDDGTTQQHRIAAGKGIILHQGNSKVVHSQVDHMVLALMDQVGICILVE